MSQGNVEFARRWMDLVNRGDVEGLARLLAPDIECFPASDQPEAAPFRGRGAFIEYANGWLEAFDRYVIEPGEYLDLGECVVVVGRVNARGRGSGVETADTHAWLIRFRDGKAIEYRECGTKERALEAAGLRG
jgi:ketosteroid isomerase-like protein